MSPSVKNYLNTSGALPEETKEVKKSTIFWSAFAGLALYVGKRIAAQQNRHRLAGKVALITGGSRGLGLQLARELALEGCRLILVARSENELRGAADELRARGSDVHTIACDLTRPMDLARMLRTAPMVFGRIDILINNAGRIDVGPVDSFSENDFEAALNLMFWAPVRIILHMLPAFLRIGDVDIVNISSIGGKIAVPHLLPYSSAKFALCGFSEGLDAEVRGRGVRVLTVTPGLMRTGSHVKARFSGKQEKEYRWFALGATIPGSSMQVSRAARQIVTALKEKKRSLTLTLSAQLAIRFHGAFPASSLMLMSYANALLPAPLNNPMSVPGADLQASQSTLINALTSFGEPAVDTQNERFSGD